MDWRSDRDPEQIRDIMFRFILKSTSIILKSTIILKSARKSERNMKNGGKIKKTPSLRQHYDVGTVDANLVPFELNFNFLIFLMFYSISYLLFIIEAIKTYV